MLSMNVARACAVMADNLSSWMSFMGMPISNPNKERLIGPIARVASIVIHKYPYDSQQAFNIKHHYGKTTYTFELKSHTTDGKQLGLLREGTFSGWRIGFC